MFHDQNFLQKIENTQGCESVAMKTGNIQLYYQRFHILIMISFYLYFVAFFLFFLLTFNNE
jgi:hypothetical protein